MNRLSILILPFLLLTLAACESEVDVDTPDDDVGVIDGTTPETTTPGTTTPGVDAWDTDRDTYLSEEEFRTGYTGTGRFDQYDTDRSTTLSEQEWTTSGQFQGQTFSDWDTDGDGALSQEEFFAGAFRQYDRDGDGRLSPDEYRELSNALGTPGGAMGTTPGTGTTDGAADGTGGTSY